MVFDIYLDTEEQRASEAPWDLDISRGANRAEIGDRDANPLGQVPGACSPMNEYNLTATRVV